ncbi:MAG: potassium-transporting ATPase subunit KdpB [Candidatus Melainabacteria bacterium]|nr:potassium-transporting ATPase subunit KdpB [Candidatus Melainabacteria bacterium]
MAKIKDNKTITTRAKIIQNATIDSLKQLNPFVMIKNPIMFVVEICFIIMIFLTIDPNVFGLSELNKTSNLIITIFLFLTLFFANFAENLAKQIGKAQVESLRLIRGDIEVKRFKPDGYIEYVFSSQLVRGDLIRVQEGDLIPLDGEIVEGMATVDESAITGESSPVLKEAGSDTASTVTGGTRVLTDSLLIKITSEQGETYLDQMVNIAEGIERHKTPNEISLNVLLTSSTISFLLAIFMLAVLMNYLDIHIEATYLIALLVCLIPTTIGGLFTPITISGFEKANALNVLAISKKSIESSGDINILFLDKTGTLTHGNRMAIEFIPVGDNSLNEIARIAYLASIFDHTPEGKSILTLAKRHGINIDHKSIKGIPHEFSAHTRMSGIDLESGKSLRKGSPEAIIKYVQTKNGTIWPETNQIVEHIAKEGSTPLLIAKNNEIIGVIHLKDLIKSNMKGKFKELSTLGIETVMCTGDTNTTARAIAAELGIYDFISQAKPEDKIHLIREYQNKGMMVAMIGDGTNDAPALAQADIGLAMNNGTVAAKEAANMIDLDSDPTKIINIVKIGRQLLTTRGAITTFSIINDITKYFALLPTIFPIAGIERLNFMHLEPGYPAILSAIIFNTLIIPAMTPIALKGINIKDLSPNRLLERNLIIFGIGGIIAPFVGMKVINLLLGGIF